MELLGEEVSQLWGRRPPFIVGGNNPTVTPKGAPPRAVLPQGAAVLPLAPVVLPLPFAVLPHIHGEQADEQRMDPVRYCHGGRAVLPLSSGTTAPTTAASAAQPDTRSAPLKLRR